MIFGFKVVSSFSRGAFFNTKSYGGNSQWSVSTNFTPVQADPGSWFEQLAVSQAFHPTICPFRTKTYPTLPLSLVWPDRERLYFSWRLRVLSPSALVGCSLSWVSRARPSCISRFVVVPSFAEDAAFFWLRVNLFF